MTEHAPEPSKCLERVPQELPAMTRLEDNPFLLWKILTFNLNLLRANESQVHQNDFFALVAEVMGRTRIIEMLHAVYPNEKLARMADIFGVDLEEDAPKEFIHIAWNSKRRHDAFRRLLLLALEEKASEYQRLVPAHAPHNRFQRRFSELVAVLGLDPGESDTLLLAYAKFLGFWNPFNRNTNLLSRIPRTNHVLVVSHAINVPMSVGFKIFADDGRLRRYNCLDADLNFSPELEGFLTGLNDEPLASNYFARHLEAPLPWAMHGKLVEQHGEFLRTLIKTRNSNRGFNILFYGQPGTGKTSFAVSLAAELGLDLYRIKKGDEGSKDYRPNSRLVSLCLCNSQVDPARSLIMIDEADAVLRCKANGLAALLGGGSATVGDKGALNTMIDQLKVPCIWITNTDSDELDPSSRRRFDYSIRFDKLSRSQRCQVWKNVVSRYHLEATVGETLIETMADRFAVSAGGVDLALRHCAQLWQQQPPAPGAAGELLEKILVPHCQLLAIPVEHGHGRVVADYALDGLNVSGKVVPQQIVEAARRFRQAQDTNRPLSPDSPRMSLLLHGPSGTGKTEFVKYLGHSLDCSVHTRMGGDLLNKYVGGTEENIRRAFHEAQTEQAILFLDEVDGLLRSRELAQQSWEVTQVNELLHAMENAGCVLVCATNAFDALDSATLRRFTFKLEFGYLDQAGKRLFYQRMLSPLCQEPLPAAQERQLSRIVDLAPGDFRTVRQASSYLGRAVSHEQLLDALEQESRAKRRNGCGGKGFGFLGQA